MQEPSWSELVLMTEQRAVERHFDARNDRFLRPALAIAAVGAIVAAIAFPASGRPVAGFVWAAVAAGIAGVVLSRRLGWFDRRPRAWLLGFLAALTAAIAVTLPEAVVVWVLAGFVLPAFLPLLRLDSPQLLGLAALLAAASGWGISRAPEDAGPPITMAVVALIWTGSFAAVSLGITRRQRQRFLLEWRRHAALTREHSRMRNELDDARAVQLSMLPRSAPELPWLELAASSLPASEVGGDYFGYFPLDGERLAIAIADVAGHGMASGLVLSGLRSGLHLLREDLARPVEVLARLDRMLRETSPGRMFVTLQIALLDAARGELTVANAGHPPLLLIRAGGESAALGEPGPPLGTRLRPGYAAVRRPLGAGDTLLLYTDGVVEVGNGGGDQLGAERLAAETARCARGGSAREVRDALLSALSNFKGDVDPADDLTLVVARITGGNTGGTA